MSDEILKNGIVGKLAGYHVNGKTYDAYGNLIPDAPPHDIDCYCCREVLFDKKKNDEQRMGNTVERD